VRSILNIPAVSPRLCDQLRESHAANASNPARQVALVGEACVCCDFSQAGPPLARQLDRTLQSQMHHVTMRRHADGSAENPREVERAASRQLCQRGDLDRLVQVSDNIVFESLEHVLAQRATCPMRDR